MRCSDGPSTHKRRFQRGSLTEAFRVALRSASIFTICLTALPAILSRASSRVMSMKLSCSLKGVVSFD